MALLPCVFGPHRFRGKSGTCYPAIIDRADQLRWKFRVCKEHAQVIQDGLKSYELTEDLVHADVQLFSVVCPSCLQNVDGLSKSLYVTAYYPGEERRDYWAKLHPNCGAPAWLPYVEPEGLPPEMAFRSLP